MSFHSCLKAGQWLKSVGLVQGSAAVWRCSAFIAWTGCIRRPCRDSMDMLRRLINCRIIIIIYYYLLFFFWFERPLHENLRLLHFKSDRDDIWLEFSSRKYASSRIFDLTSHFQDVGHDVISSTKVLPPGECTLNVCPAHIQQCPSVTDPYFIHTFFQQRGI